LTVTSTSAAAGPRSPARRAPRREMITGMAPQPTGPQARSRPQPAPKGPRRFPALYKITVLAEYDTLDRAGKTALLRREQLRASQISRWRAQVYDAALEALGAEPGSQPARRIHVSESAWQQFSAAAAAADPPFRPEQLIRAFVRYYAGLTDYLPPRPTAPSASERSEA
jgi:hypothetical protein